MNFLAKLLQGISLAPSVVHGVEGLLGAKSGNEKKNAALTFVQSAISTTDAIANKQIVDPAKFNDGLGKVIDGVVACLNASVWTKKTS
ncbi:MAG TPA: hypothetical protein VMT34_01160 [Aggregatilineales bacterium]|nr:hypothetical protein [Aggregatilineales bacterium]